MMTQYKKMDVVSNNIANADTKGFKKDGVVSESFGETLMLRLNDPGDTSAKPIGKIGMGVKVDNIYTNFEQGSLVGTEGQHDIALRGSGFFSIEILDGQGDPQTRYSRDGQLAVTNEGYLVTSDGNKLIGANGAIKLPEGYKNLAINNQGHISADGNYVDQLKLVDIKDASTLRKIGKNLYAPTTGTEETEFKGKVVQGYVESSNVNTVREMIEMISVSRAYESSQKMLTVNDEMLGKAVNEVGDL